MIIIDEELGYIHINTGEKKLSEKEIEEAKEFIKSKRLKRIIDKSNESSKRVKQS